VSCKGYRVGKRLGTLLPTTEDEARGGITVAELLASFDGFLGTGDFTTFTKEDGQESCKVMVVSLRETKDIKRRGGIDDYVGTDPLLRKFPQHEVARTAPGGCHRNGATDLLTVAAGRDQSLGARGLQAASLFFQAKRDDCRSTARSTCFNSYTSCQVALCEDGPNTHPRRRAATSKAKAYPEDLQATGSSEAAHPARVMAAQG